MFKMHRVDAFAAEMCFCDSDMADYLYMRVYLNIFSSHVFSAENRSPSRKMNYAK